MRFAFVITKVEPVVLGYWPVSHNVTFSLAARYEDHLARFLPISVVEHLRRLGLALESRRVIAKLLKVEHYTGLNLGDQGLKTLIKHALSGYEIGSTASDIAHAVDRRVDCVRYECVLVSF